MAERLAAHAALRSGTRDEHDRVDALFAHFDIAEPAAYRDFLIAHAAALASVEAALDQDDFAADLPDWPDRRRRDAIAADLAALDAPMPPPLPAPALGSAAARWGAAYVVEGSRLGGAMLARAVPDTLPKSYLGTAPAMGSWRGFLAALDKALPSAQDRDLACASARMIFAMFEAAGRHMLERS